MEMEQLSVKYIPSKEVLMLMVQQTTQYWNQTDGRGVDRDHVHMWVSCIS